MRNAGLALIVVVVSHTGRGGNGAGDAGGGREAVEHHRVWRAPR